METLQSFIVRVADSYDYKYAYEISEAMAASASKRSTGIARRTPEYIIGKILDNLAVIAINPINDDWVGFSCLEVWQHQQYVAGTGLIVTPDFRGTGAARAIKHELFKHYNAKFPAAKLFSITTSPRVIRINEELGFRPLKKEVVLEDQLFLEGNNCWVDYIELLQKDMRYSAMVFEPEMLLPAAHTPKSRSGVLMQVI